MKQWNQLMLLAMLVAGFSFTASSQYAEWQVEQVSERVHAIDQDTSLSSLTLNNEEFLGQMTDGGGQLTGYFKGDTVYKIQERIGLSYCITIKEFYFWHGELIFVFEREEAFPYIDSLAAFDYTRTETTYQGQYFFDSAELVAVRIEGEKRIHTGIDDDPQAKAEQLLGKANRNVDLLKKRKSQNQR